MSNVFIDKCLNVQIELSSKCNSLCLGCVRADSTFSNTRKIIPKNIELPLNIIEKLFKSKEMSEVNTIEFCGTIDEPLIHSQFIEIMELLYSINPLYQINIHTNGSLRNKEFWKN